MQTQRRALVTLCNTFPFIVLAVTPPCPRGRTLNFQSWIGKLKQRVLRKTSMDGNCFITAVLKLHVYTLDLMSKLAVLTCKTRAQNRVLSVFTLLRHTQPVFDMLLSDVLSIFSQFEIPAWCSRSSPISCSISKPIQMRANLNVHLS